jgi:thiol:disulfide interchange protein DsbD
MMTRTLLLLLLAGTLVARASDFISAPVQGASASVSQPHVTAELIPETTSIQPGKPFEVALHLHSDPGWHTYWINPGDAGYATSIKWTLPEGFTAGPIQWPTPEKHAMGPEVTFGYEGDVYLLTTITPPKTIPQGSNKIVLKAHAGWLVCQEACIPGQADFELPLDSGVMTLRLPVENTDFFAQARERMPVPNTRWEVKAAYGVGGGTVDKQAEALWILFTIKPDAPTTPVGNVYFFPEQPNVLNANENDNGGVEPATALNMFELPLTLQQNGEKPGQISGVLVSDQLLINQSKSVYIAAFPTDAKGLPMMVVRTGMNLGAAGLNACALPATAPVQAQPLLLAVLGFAFIGGLILNLMPCVLPVLSLKVFSLVRHAGENPKTAWKQGAAFTVGVIISFWILAGLLLILRAAGNHLGWGFQMQSPGFVLALIFLFFLLGLNLFGVFELGTSLVGLDAKATGKFHGLTSSFLNGVLATVAATPCTAPFMGSSLGFAAQQPPFVAMLIFTFLALGMATPYLLLTIFPGALRYVPKPGAWMEAFKQFMGFLLMATVVFLIYVFSALVGQDGMPILLGALLITAMAAWIYGRSQNPTSSTAYRLAAGIVAVLVFVVSIALAVNTAIRPIGTHGSNKTYQEASADGWQPWSQAAVDAALAQGRPVFVDFTAAWCLSCKVNESLVLGTDAVKKAFADKNIALFRADWTHSDPEISKTLQQFKRDGVPLYLFYSPKNKDAPQILPEVLTPGIILNALQNL